MGADQALVGVEFVPVGAGFGLAQGLDPTRLPARDATGLTFAQQDLDQVIGAAVTKQLAFVFFMEGHTVLGQQGGEVAGRVARQRRAAEVGVLAQKVFVGCARVELAVGEVGPSAPRDADFFGHFGAVVQDQNAQTPLRGHARTKQTRGACADHHCVPCVHGG